LVGVAVKDGKLTLDPLAPPEWDYYRLSGVKVLGEEYDITYDKNGEVYGQGRGLTVKKVNNLR
jgi:cellobiose phosphorylase